MQYESTTRQELCELLYSCASIGGNSKGCLRCQSTIRPSWDFLPERKVRQDSRHDHCSTFCLTLGSHSIPKSKIECIMMRTSLICLRPHSSLIEKITLLFPHATELRPRARQQTTCFNTCNVRGFQVLSWLSAHLWLLSDRKMRMESCFSMSNRLVL